MHLPRLKSGSEEGGGGFWESCREITAQVWTLAVGAITATGETVTSVSSRFLAGVGTIFTIVLCMQREIDNAEYCLAHYVNCGGAWAVPNSGGYGYTMCERCRKACVRDHAWHCPVPI